MGGDRGGRGAGRPGRVVVSYQSPPDRTDVTTVTIDLPAGLARVDGYTRDGLTVTPQYSGDRVHVVVAKAPSATAVILAVAGLVVGAALGVLAALAALRRHRRHPRGRRAIAEVVGSVMVAVAAGYAALAETNNREPMVAGETTTPSR